MSYGYEDNSTSANCRTWCSRMTTLALDRVDSKLIWLTYDGFDDLLYLSMYFRLQNGLTSKYSRLHRKPGRTLFPLRLPAERLLHALD